MPSPGSRPKTPRTAIPTSRHKGGADPRRIRETRGTGPHRLRYLVVLESSPSAPRTLCGQQWSGLKNLPDALSCAEKHLRRERDRARKIEGQASDRLAAWEEERKNRSRLTGW